MRRPLDVWILVEWLATLLLSACAGRSTVEPSATSMALKSATDIPTTQATEIPRLMATSTSQPCAPKFSLWTPVWAPDSKTLAFYSDSGIPSRLYLTNLDSGTVSVSQDLDRGSMPDAPAWSPDGKHLAVIWHRRLAVINSDESGLTQLDPGPAVDYSPSWSPDGRQILYTSEIAGPTAALEVVNANGSRKVRLTNHLVGGGAAAWSPDGTKILFTLIDENGRTAIAIMNRDGSHFATLTPYATTYGDPVWSPNGKLIAYDFFEKPQIDAANVFVMDIDGTHMARLTVNSDKGSFGPVWSLDGKRIAFWAGNVDDPTQYVRVMNSDGSGTVQLTKNWSGGFSWSPDSSKIAYSMDTSQEPEIFVVNADGTNIRQVTHNPTNLPCLR